MIPAVHALRMSVCHYYRFVMADYLQESQCENKDERSLRPLIDL